MTRKLQRQAIAAEEHLGYRYTFTPLHSIENVHTNCNKLLASTLTNAYKYVNPAANAFLLHIYDRWRDVVMLQGRTEEMLLQYRSGQWDDLVVC